MSHRSCLLAITSSVALLAACSKAPAPPTSRAPVRVAAAADLARAFAVLGADFERATGQGVTFSFGSTGLLAKQLREGAPFDLFAAANVSFVDEVVAAKACDGATKRPYARGRIAVWSKQGGVTPPSTIEQLAEARFTKIAIASPQHAPYGQAARDALQAAGVWATVEPRLVFGENVSQTLQLAHTGNVEAAIVALSLVVDDKTNPWFLVEEQRHAPIEQAMAVCVNGGNREGGLAFATYVASDAGRATMRRFGFLLPGEALTKQP